ncbi:MAG TPA: hypothetical protein ENK15_02910 [Thermopetrobacter sp.]|nr:hypothetical protein [Thermopetrobacter sp.]
MLKLFLLAYIMASVTFAGALMTAALAMRLDNTTMLLMTALGFLLAVPAAWYAAKQIAAISGNKV